MYDTTGWQEIVLSHQIFRTIANKVLESLILNRNLQTTSLYHVRKFYSYLNYWKAMRHMHNPKFMNKVIKRSIECKFLHSDKMVLLHYNEKYCNLILLYNVSYVRTTTHTAFREQCWITFWATF